MLMIRIAGRNGSGPTLRTMVTGHA